VSVEAKSVMAVIIIKSGIMLIKMEKCSVMDLNKLIDSNRSHIKRIKYQKGKLCLKVAIRFNLILIKLLLTIIR